MCRLSDIEIGRECRVKYVDSRLANAQRLADLGLTEGTSVVPLHEAPLGGDPRAYYIRGAVMALRNADADGIAVEISEGENGHG